MSSIEILKLGSKVKIYCSKSLPVLSISLGILTSPLAICSSMLCGSSLFSKGKDLVKYKKTKITLVKVHIKVCQSSIYLLRMKTLS